MKIFIKFTLALLLFVPFEIYSSEKIKFEIELYSLPYGKKIKYKISNKRINVFKESIFGKYIIIGSKKMCTEKADTLNQIIKQIRNSYNFQDTSFGGGIDGNLWILRIDINDHKMKLTVDNCYHQKLDEAIKLINSELRRRKKLIFFTAYFYKDCEC